MTPAQLIALGYIADRGVDPSTGRRRSVDLREISEPTRQRIIDLGMMEPPLVDVDGPWVFLTKEGREKYDELNADLDVSEPEDDDMKDQSDKPDKKIPDGYEMFEGKVMKVINGDRSGWWRFYDHYDRNGYCDNPARGY